MSYNAVVSETDGETYLHVAKGLSVGTWPKLALYSSDELRPNIALDSEVWAPGVAWSAQDRMRNGGDDKGRAIAIWHRARNADPTPLAVLTWHTEGTGPFYLFNLGARTNLNAPFRRQLEAVLLDVMLCASKHHEAPVAPEWQNTLRWATAHFEHAPHDKRAAFAREAIKHAKRLSFTKHQPPPAAPEAMSKTWLGERSF